MNRSELIDLVNKIKKCEGTEEERTGQTSGR